MKQLLTHITIFAATALMSCAQSHAQNNIRNFDAASIGLEGEILVFIGEQVAYSDAIPREEWCPEDLVCFSTRYHARYRILEIVQGNIDTKEIDFIVYDSGSPRARDHFTTQGTVLLYLVREGDEWVHVRHQFEPVSKLSDGGWGTCGDPYSSLDPEKLNNIEREPLKVLDFVEPRRVHISDVYLPLDYNLLSQQNLVEEEHARLEFELASEFYAAPVWELQGDELVCRMGMTPEDVVRIHKELGSPSDQG